MSVCLCGNKLKNFIKITEIKPKHFYHSAMQQNVSKMENFAIGELFRQFLLEAHFQPKSYETFRRKQ
jgi:hypothetical protein